MLELTITAGGGQFTRKVELTGERPVTIGRSSECDIRIGHPTVSRNHAEVRRMADGTWVLTDLGSTHGCLVSGDRVERMPIVSGVTVTIGPARLSFDNLADRIGRELDQMLAGDEPNVEIKTGAGHQPLDETQF